MLYTSAAGAVSDADLAMATTSTNANTTDNTAVLQALIDQASTTGAKIIWDGKYAHSGLLLKSNVHIEVLPGMGCWLRTGANKPIFRTVRSFAVPLTFNVRISGMIAHGNPGGQTGRGTPQFGLNTAYSIYGVQNFILENFTTLAHRTYAFHGMGIRNGIVRNGVTDYGAVKWENQDGIHFDGYCRDCLGENLTLTTEDDAITCNADDGYRAPGWGEGWCGDFYYRDEEPGGPANGITFRNINIQAFRCGARILSAGSRVDNILLENIYGNTSEMGLVVDSYQGFGGVSVPGTGNIGRITVRDWSLNVARRVGSFSKPANTQFGCDIEQLVIENWRRTLFDTDEYPTLYFYTGNIKNVQVRGYVQRNAVNNIATPFIKNDGATIGNISIDGAIVERTGTTNFSPVFKQTAGSFGVLSLRGIIGKNIHNIIEIAAGTAGIVKVADVTHTGSTEFSFFSAVPVPVLVASNVYPATAALINSATNFANKAGDAFGSTTTTPPPTDPGGTPNSTPIWVDDFATATKDARWTEQYFDKPQTGTRIQQNGRLELTPLANAESFAAYTEAAAQSFSNGALQVEVVTAPAAPTQFNTEMGIGIDTLNRARWVTEAGVLYAQTVSPNGNTGESLPYDAVAHRHWRIRHSSTTNLLYWETSPDGVAWVSRFNAAPPFPVTGLIKTFIGGYLPTTATATATAVFDNAKRF
ncbi:glycoside hydrolase family protein [Hymenobacter lapidiphilus]|uniref:hypothetical protein n=1 Tax=Hymenobacter sp. CCM 8763 TaxID=2303334 RepID=UPI0011C16CBC|nr:hypothetical protein [Hymenobacter sp. CCM 8763]